MPPRIAAARQSELPSDAISKNRIAAAIRRRRRMEGVTVGELAAKVGVAISTMSKIETGKLSTSVERLETISHALRSSVAELVGAVGTTAGPDVSPSPYGSRISVVASADASSRGGSGNSYTPLAADLLHKSFQPAISEILVGSLTEHGPLIRCMGERFILVLEGRMELHTDTYAPIRLDVGSSAYFDAEMPHAHIKVGDETCRVLLIDSPRRSSQFLPVREVRQPTL